MDLLPILPLIVFVYLLPTTLNMYQSIFSMPCVLSSYPGHLWVQFKKCHFSCNSSYSKQDTHTKILKDHPKSCPKIQNIFIYLTCENALVGICFSVKPTNIFKPRKEIYSEIRRDNHKKKAFGVDCETNTKVFLRSVMRRRRKYWLNNKKSFMSGFSSGCTELQESQCHLLRLAEGLTEHYTLDHFSLI